MPKPLTKLLGEIGIDGIPVAPPMAPRLAIATTQDLRMSGDTYRLRTRTVEELASLPSQLAGPCADQIALIRGGAKTLTIITGHKMVGHPRGSYCAMVPHTRTVPVGEVFECSLDLALRLLGALQYRHLFVEVDGEDEANEAKQPQSPPPRRK